MKTSALSVCFCKILFLSLALIMGCSDGNDSAGSSLSEVPEPSLVEQLPGEPLLGGPFFDGIGYELSEYLVSGVADSYTNVNEFGPDGRWEIQPAESLEYSTRIVVFRPSEPASFNGTVVVEWLNVSAGSDVASDWRLTHTELTRSGYAWVGVSAQERGVTSLKNSGEDKYAPLNHPGDSFSYSIFSQVARLIRSDQGKDVLGDLDFDAILAAGESQSASRLLTYVNALSLRDSMYDGYFIHSRYYSSASLSQSPQPDIAAPEIVLVRDDIRVPVMMFQTESDVVALSSYLNRQDDTDYFRLWEAAGTAHADYYITITTNTDMGDDPSVAAVFEESLFCDKPINTGPQHFVAKAALSALNAWVVEGQEPAIADRLEVVDSIPELSRDRFGNALGGIRTPFVDAPLATLSGEGNSSESFGFCNRLFGTTKLLDASTVAARYADSDSYRAEVNESTDKAVAEGFLLSEDAVLIKEYASQVDIFDTQRGPEPEPEEDGPRGFEILEPRPDGTFRVWVGPTITGEEFAALELPDGWIKNTPREAGVDGPDASRFLRSPDGMEDGDYLFEEFFGLRWLHVATVVEQAAPLDDDGLLRVTSVRKYHEITYNAGSSLVLLVAPSGEVYFRIGRDADRTSDEPTIPSMWQLVEYTTEEPLVLELFNGNEVIRADNEDSFQGPVEIPGFNEF